MAGSGGLLHINGKPIGLVEPEILRVKAEEPLKLLAACKEIFDGVRGEGAWIEVEGLGVCGVYVWMLGE